MKTRILIITLLFGILAVYPQNNWRVVGQMPVPVSGPEAVVKDSLIYIIGGYSDSLRSNVDIVQEYNPRANTWRVLRGVTRQKREGFVVLPFRDSLLMIGGAISTSAGRQQMEIWKVGSSASNAYRANNNFNRQYAAGQILGDRIILFGGVYNNTASDTSLHYIIEYSLSSGTVTYRYDSTFTQFRQPALQMSEMIDSSVYLFGGVYERTLTTIFRYDIKMRRLTRLPAQLPRARAGGEVIEIRPRELMIIGGYNDQRALNTVEICSINGNNINFQSGPSMVSPRWDFAAVLYENAVYVFGGEELFSNSNPTVEKLDLLDDIETPPAITESFTLLGNYPNPFNPSTQIRFSLSERMKVEVEVYDVQGKLVKVLAGGEFEQGIHSVTWDGRDSFGIGKSSGVYFYRIRHAYGTVSRKMLLLQ